MTSPQKVEYTLIRTLILNFDTKIKLKSALCRDLEFYLLSANDVTNFVDSDLFRQLCRELNAVILEFLKPLYSGTRKDIEEKLNANLSDFFALSNVTFTKKEKKNISFNL